MSYRTHLGHMPDLLKKGLTSLALAISGDAGDWDNGSIKANKFRAGVKKVSETPAGSNERTYLSQVDYAMKAAPVVATLDGDIKRSMQDSIMGQINQYIGQFKRDLILMNKKGANLSGTEITEWGEYEKSFYESQLGVTKDGKAVVLSKQDNARRESLFKVFNEQYLKYRDDLRKTTKQYEVPAYLIKHHSDMLKLYNSIQGTMEEAGGGDMVYKAKEAKTPYHWKKRGAPKKEKEDS